MACLHCCPPVSSSSSSASCSLSGVPNEAASERFRQWTERLGGVISDTPLPNMPVGAQLVPIKETVQILKVCGSFFEPP